MKGVLHYDYTEDIKLLLLKLGSPDKTKYKKSLCHYRAVKSKLLCVSARLCACVCVLTRCMFSGSCSAITNYFLLLVDSESQCSLLDSTLTWEEAIRKLSG